MLSSLSLSSIINQILRKSGSTRQGGILFGCPTYKKQPNGGMVVSVPYYSSDPKLVNATLLGLAKPTFRLENALAPYRGSVKAFVTNFGDELPVPISDRKLLVRRPSSVELRFIKVQYPYLDNNILAQYTRLNANKYAFFRIHSAVFKKGSFFSAPISLTSESLPYLLKGLKLELAGRLTTQRSIPRKTVSNKHIGNIGTNGHFNQYASKNKLGAYTIKV